MVSKSRWKALRWVADTALLLLLGACGRTQRSTLTAAEAKALDVVLYEASHPCRNQRPTITGASGPAPEFLIETVLLGVPLAANIQTTYDIQRLADIPDLRLLGTPTLSGRFDETTTRTLEEHFGVLDQPTLSRISLRLLHGQGAQPVMELELGVSLPNADPAKTPSIADTSFVLEAASGKPALGVAQDPGDPTRRVIAVVNAYPIQGDDNRRTLFECKMRLHQRALEQR